MNKDQKLIAEAYSRVYLKESTDDLNHLPSLEEIKSELTRIYNQNKRFYSPENYEKKTAGLDEKANLVQKLLTAHADWVKKFNEENPSREPYTLWSSVYSELSDASKDLNGFRHRTNPKETPIVILALSLLDINEALKKKYEEEDREAARPKSHAETLYSSDPQKVDQQVVDLINDNSNLPVQSLATKIDKEIIKSEEFGKVEGPYSEEGMEKYNVRNVINTIKQRKDINLDPDEKEALIKELREMYKVK